MFYIRKITDSEVEFLLDMMYESIHIPENKPPRDILLNSPGLKKYSEGWGRHGDNALIALDKDHKPLGAVWYRLFDESNKGYGYVDPNTPELGIAVLKNGRGMGVGGALMQEILKIAKEEGLQSISLSVNPENITAVHLYRKLGFIECGFSGTSITMVYNID